jgi:hypothetical protein
MILLGAAVLTLLAPLAFSAGSSRAEPESSDCRSGPGSRAGEGQHWYYRIDRSSKRRCWYLGPVGAKVRKAAISKRRSALRSTARRTATIPTGDAVKMQPETDQFEAAAETTPVETSTTVEISTDFSTRWPGYVKAVTVDRAPELRRNSYADEDSTPHSADDMPLIWPILKSSELVSAGQPVGSALGLPLFLVLIAGALALAAVLARGKIFAARHLRWRDGGVPRRLSAKIARPRRFIQAPATTMARKSGVVRKPPAASRRTPIGGELPVAHSVPMGHAADDLDLSHLLRTPAGRVAEEFGPCDLGQDLEESLRLLLRGWQRVAA